MSKVLSVASALVEHVAPAGTVVDHYHVSLHDGASEVQSASLPVVAGEVALSHSFDVPAGTYTVTVSAVDAAGAVIGAPEASDPLTVVEDATVTVQVPSKPVLTVA